jgi:hypothetical protein
VGELEAMLREPLGDPGLQLAFSAPADDGWVDADGQPIPVPDPASGRVLTEVERDGQAAAAIVHDAQLAEEPELLRAAGAIALLAQENAQLETAWNGSLRQLRDSRRRLVAASEGERRKLERDLHDGAQQRLVSLRIGLAIASEHASADSAVSAKLGELEADLDEAIQELRDLAHGIFPCPRRPRARARPARGERERPAADRGDRAPHRPLPAGDRVGGLLLLPRGSPERDQARRAGGAHRSEPQR